VEVLLAQWNGLQVCLSHQFSGEMLSPILENLLDKARTGWDDYDEVFHCCQLIQAVAQDPDLHMDFHTLRHSGQTVGLGLMTAGKVNCPLFFPKGLAPTDPESSVLLFNYFHISPTARGVGEQWLREILLPHYAQQGFHAVYVKSSHPKVFSLYSRLGDAVGHYSTPSDNGLFVRSGTLFRIPLSSF
jgi:hypothetical protein